MSTEDKANEVSAEDRDRHSATPLTDPGTQDPAGGAGGTITLFFILGLVASLVVGWVIFPQLLFMQQQDLFENGIDLDWLFFLLVGLGKGQHLAQQFTQPDRVANGGDDGQIQRTRFAHDEVQGDA